MSRSTGSQLCYLFAVTWSAFTSLLLLIISVQVLQNPVFPLGLGAIHTVGKTGLLLTLLPAAVGLLAVLLSSRRVRSGLWLLGFYSVFWAGILLAAFPSIWNAKSSFCFRTVCITSPWLGRLLLFVLTMPFVLVALWTYRELRGEQTLVTASAPRRFIQ